MHSLTASKQKDNSVPSSITLFVALYLIILAFFIILTKDLSFDDYKQTVAMHSIYKTFGRPKTQEVYFGVIDEGKIDDFHGEVEAIFGDQGKIIVSVDSSKFELHLDKDFLYFSDEVNFKPEVLDSIVALKDVIRRWHIAKQPSFLVGLSETDYEIDKQRIDYFRTDFSDIEFITGLNVDNNNKFSLIVVNKIGER